MFLLLNGIGFVTLGRSSAEIQPVESVPGLMDSLSLCTRESSFKDLQDSTDCATENFPACSTKLVARRRKVQVAVQVD